MLTMNLKQALHQYALSYKAIQEMMHQQLTGIKSQLQNMTDAGIVNRLLTQDISIKNDSSTFYSLAKVYNLDTPLVQNKMQELLQLQDRITKQGKKLFAPLNATEFSLGPKFLWVHLANEESLGFTLLDPAVPCILAKPLEKEEKEGMSLMKVDAALKEKAEAILNEELL